MSAPPSRKAFPILTNPSTPETSNSSIPTAAQLADTRLKQWHQQGEALLTIENLRGWINATGLVMFANRPQIASPAPSLVEAVLGASNPNPTIEQTAEARSLLARLVAEGLAVPLNLMGPGVGTVHAGAPGDTPDFVASTAVFSYVFTLRGDKAWKQPPATTGALKVSNLALAIHEALTRRGALTAYDLTTEVGKEVTEAAVLRALGELWTHLRVLPLAQPDGAATLWELSSARFTKQIKAGANAGQPSALSALISLYLGQAVVASEDEVESFLSPLASRSRIRDVIHALLAARELETIAVEGRTMLHVTGALPAFLAPAAVAASETEAAGEARLRSRRKVAAQDADGTGEAPVRITKYVPKPRKIGTGYLAKAKPSKFAAKPGRLSGERRRLRGWGSRTGLARDSVRCLTGSGGRSRSRQAAASISPGMRRSRAVWRLRGSRRRFATMWGVSLRQELGTRFSHVLRGSTSRVLKAGTVESLAGSRHSAGSRRLAISPHIAASLPSEASLRLATDARHGMILLHAPRERAVRRVRRGRRSASRERLGASARDLRRGVQAMRVRRGVSLRPARVASGGRVRDPIAGSARDLVGHARRVRMLRGHGAIVRSARKAAEDLRHASRMLRVGPVSSVRRHVRPMTGTERTASGPRERQDRGPSGEGGKRVYKKFDAPRDRPARGEGFGGDARKSGGDFAPRKVAVKPGGKTGGFAGKSSGFACKKRQAGGFGGKKSGGFGKKSDKPFTGKPSSTFAKFAGNKKPFGKRPPARKFKPNQGESA